MLVNQATFCLDQGDHSLMRGRSHVKVTWSRLNIGIRTIAVFIAHYAKLTKLKPSYFGLAPGYRSVIIMFEMNSSALVILWLLLLSCFHFM